MPRLSVTQTFQTVTPQEFAEFIEYLRNKDHRYRTNLSQLQYADYACYLSLSRAAGYALSKERNGLGEYKLANVFSTVTGTGAYAVNDAISRREKLWLSCFENLESFYSRFGFVVTAKEKNWTQGGPDVLFMSTNTRKASLK